jgi:hypothetical protein
MFGVDNILGRLGLCGCKDFSKNTSCDVLWIIILLLIVFKGGMFGIDICTLIILFIVFGKDLLGGGCRKTPTHCC